MQLLTKEEIKNFLNEIKTSVSCEIKPLFSLYSDYLEECYTTPGMRSIPRIIFPEIDGLARLRYGYVKNRWNSKLPVQFMREYFPIKQYKEISGFIYNVFRHGLVHSHWPKMMIISNKVVGWSMTISSQKDNLLEKVHLTCPDPKKNHLNLNAWEFYEDFLASIDNYVKDFDNGDFKKENELIQNFSRAHFKMHEPEDMRKGGIIKDSDINFFI